MARPRTKRPGPPIPPALWWILAAALALRLWGVADRLPDATLGINPMDDTAVDEGDRRAMLYSWEMWRGGTVPLDLNPGTGDWPGLSFYVTLGLQFVYRGAWLALHGGQDAASFARHVQSGPAGFFLFARIFGALLGVLTVFVAYLVGKLLAGADAALLAALFLALNPAHVLASQRVSDPNLLALLFVTLAMLYLLRFLEAPGARASAAAGAMVGLAGACKYVPLAAVATLVVVHGEAWRDGRLRGAAAWRSLAAGFGACAGGFAVASPYTLLDWKAKSVDVALQRGRLMGDWVGQSSFPIALPAYVVHTLPAMMGWPAYLLALAGTVVLWRRGAAGRVVVLVPLLLLLANGVLALATERFMLPALTALEIAAASTVMALVSRVGGESHRTTAVAAACAVAVVAWPLPDYVALRRALQLEDTRHVSLRWIEASIPKTEPLGYDLYGPALPLAPDKGSNVVWPFLAAQSPLVRPAYHSEWLDGLRYYVTSSEVDRRFESDRARYPLETAFYRWIRSRGARVWASDSSRASGPVIEVWELPSAISTRAERDSLWASVGRDTAYAVRLVRWCSDLSQVYLWRDDYARAGEWAERGLGVGGGGPAAPRTRMFEVLAISRLRTGDPAAAERTAREGLARFPDSPLLHLYRGMALEEMGRSAEALAECRAALPLCPNESAAGVVRAAIARIEAGRSSP